ncbi:RNA-directed DNA polymerase, eukaryota, reverse transcriptase zinc-binding domain protein, partial [Tanacetum coccineum]
VTSGNAIIFWHDIWAPSQKSLKDQFLRLYALENQKFCRLNSRWICDNNVWVWNWDWRLPLRGRSLDDLNDLISSLNLPPLVVDSIDSWKHVLSPKGVFIVNYLSRSIDKPLAATSPNAQIMQWNPWLPKMVNIFIWRVVLDRLPHLENLIARDVTVDSDLCHLEPKNRDHLFLIVKGV